MGQWRMKRGQEESRAVPLDEELAGGAGLGRLASVHDLGLWRRKREPLSLIGEEGKRTST